MKTKKRSKWYAYYGGSSEYGILSEEDYKKELEELNEDPQLNSEKITFLKYIYRDFENFSSAKKYLLMHLMGERDELSMAVKQLKKFKGEL